MLTIQSDPTVVLETGGSGVIYAVAFDFDRKHILGGGKDGIQRWRLADGREVGKQEGISDFNAIAVSRDHKWVVWGTSDEGASVWDAKMEEKIITVEGTKQVSAVDVSPDSSRFATGTGAGDVGIWRITSRKRRLVGPLKHDHLVTGVRFSPSGEHIATSCLGSSVRIFNSRNGDQLIQIHTTTPGAWPITPLAWSNNGQHIFTVADNNTIKSFALSTESQLAESPILAGGSKKSIALAPNGKFIVTIARDAILFLDTSTLSPIVPAIEGREYTTSIAISPDGNYLATGQRNGKINVRNLGSILPDVYGPFHVSICPLLIMLAFCVSPGPSSPLTYYIRHLLAVNIHQTRRL